LDLGHLRAGFSTWHRKAEMMSSRLADLVVANAEAVREVCIREEGVRPENCVVVRNGIDLERFDAIAAHGLHATLPVPDGAPIVATRVGGNPELVREGENGFLVPYGDAQALAEALRALLSAPEQAREMGLRGRRRVESALSMEMMAEGHGALYRRALGGAPVVREAQLRAA